jgi:adhesin transport system outer membrane protein
MQELSDSSIEVYESFVRLYPVGRKTWVEVLNARREATQARLSLTEAQWSGYAASLRIKINTGEIDHVRLNIQN